MPDECIGRWSQQPALKEADLQEQPLAHK